MGEHDEYTDEDEDEAAFFDWKHWTESSLEAMERARDLWLESVSAGRDVSGIAREHLEEMTERLDSIRAEGATASELHREMTKHYAAMADEMLRADTVLRLCASNMDIFLDWKIALQEFQEQYLRSAGLLTPDELSEIYRELHDLRRKMERLSTDRQVEGHDSGK